MKARADQNPKNKRTSVDNSACFLYMDSVPVQHASQNSSTMFMFVPCLYFPLETKSSTLLRASTVFSSAHSAAP
jgi:hypothetical protein